MKKPGTNNGTPRESREEFAARIAKEMREEAKRVLSDAQKQAKTYRKIASSFDGKRS
jgi:cell division septum initiation protein DivIVA